MIETKEIKLYNDQKVKQYIQDLTAFGWQPSQETSRRSGRSTNHYQIMARETSMPNYNMYRRFEEDYEAAKGEIEYYPPMEASTVLLLFLFLIIPGILYVVYKKSESERIEDHNRGCNARMIEAVKSARNIK